MFKHINTSVSNYNILPEWASYFAEFHVYVCLFTLLICLYNYLIESTLTHTHKLVTHVFLQTKHLKIITAIAVTVNLLPMMFKFQLGYSHSCYPKFQTVYLKGKYILSVCKYRAAALYFRGCLNFSGGRQGIPTHQVFVTECVAVLFSTRWLFILSNLPFLQNKQGNPPGPDSNLLRVQKPLWITVHFFSCSKMVISSDFIHW